MQKSVKTIGPRDRETINMNEGFDVRYWSNEFGVSAEQLKQIVGRVGPKTDAVRKEIAAGPARPWRS